MNQRIKWTDKDGFAKVADLPPEMNASGPGNGQIVRLKDGTFVIPRTKGSSRSITRPPRAGRTTS